MPRLTIQTNGFCKRQVLPWCSTSHYHLRAHFRAVAVAKLMLVRATEADRYGRAFAADQEARAIAYATKASALRYARDWGATAREELEQFMRSRGWPGPIECAKGCNAP